MSGWEVGDLAVAVGAKKTAENAHRFESYGPEKGKIYSVRAIIYVRDRIGLLIDGPQSQCPAWKGAWDSICFRKIKPDNEPCEQEFVALLKVSKPSKVGETA